MDDRYALNPILPEQGSKLSVSFFKAILFLAALAIGQRGYCHDVVFIVCASLRASVYPSNTFSSEINE